jgi:hypothetical protein
MKLNASKLEGYHAVNDLMFSRYNEAVSTKCSSCALKQSVYCKTKNCRAFIGPLGGGYLHDLLKFEMSAVVIGSCSFFSVSSCC